MGKGSQIWDLLTLMYPSWHVQILGAVQSAFTQPGIHLGRHVLLLLANISKPCLHRQIPGISQTPFMHSFSQNGIHVVVLFATGT